MPLYDLGDIDDVGRRAGMCMTFAAIGVIAGPPISGAINNATGGFSAVGFYGGKCILVLSVVPTAVLTNFAVGSMMLLSCVLMLITRHLVLRKFFGKF
jgi:MFS transporter, MCT family, solute carrier family 16 (monocarboxylic acid transporters), member 10